jgi:hypothetical protein
VGRKLAKVAKVAEKRHLFEGLEARAFKVICVTV